MKHFFSPTLSCLTRWARRWLTGRGATWRVALLLWLSHVPYLWLYYPGCWGFPDTESSVNHYFGYADFTTWLCGGTAAHPLCNHHPIVYTYLYGGLMQLGARAGSVEAAVAAFLAVQAAVQAVLLAVGVVWMTRRLRTRATVVAVYALLPVFGMWSTLLLKDSVFALCTTALVLCLWRWARRMEGADTRRPWRLTVLTCGVLAAFMLSKNQCVYLVCLTALALPLLYGRRALLPAGVCVVWVAVYALFVGALPRMGVATSGPQEMLGTAFQQTARYVRYYPDEVRPEERAAIAAVLPYDSLAVLYDATNQDAVKFCYRRSATAAERRAYLRVWAAMGLRRPTCYAQSVWLGCRGYFVPTGRYTLFYPTHTYEAEHAALFPRRALWPSAPCGMAAWAGVPVVGWVVDMGFLIPLFVVCYVWAMWRRQRAVVLSFVPCALSVLVLVVSPVDGSFRYVMPIVWHLPLLCGAVCEARNRAQGRA